MKRTEAFDDLAISVNQKLKFDNLKSGKRKKNLGKVPLDGVEEQTVLFALEIIVERIGCLAVDVYLAVEVRVELVLVFHEVLDIEIT